MSMSLQWRRSRILCGMQSRTVLVSTLDTSGCAVGNGVSLSPAVFNSVVVACLRHVQPTLAHHLSFKKQPKQKWVFPASPCTEHLAVPLVSSHRLVLPSSHQCWRALRHPVRTHLQDVLQVSGQCEGVEVLWSHPHPVVSMGYSLLECPCVFLVTHCVCHHTPFCFPHQLLGGLAEASMVCALLRHIDGLWTYYSCFPKLSRILERRLVVVWGGGMDEARVLAFLVLRRMVIASLSSKQNRREKLLKVSDLSVCVKSD